MQDLVKCWTCRLPQGANAKRATRQQYKKSGHRLAMGKEHTLKERLTSWMELCRQVRDSTGAVHM